MMRLIGNVTNADPMIVTSNQHGFTDQAMNIWGVQGCLAANGPWSDYTIIDADHFSLPAAGSGDYTGMGTIDTGTFDQGNNYVYPSNITGITDDIDHNVILVASHDLQTGDHIGIIGCDVAEANGNWTVTVIDSTHFYLDGLTMIVQDHSCGGMFWERP